MEQKELEKLIDKKIADHQKKADSKKPMDSLLSANRQRHQNERRMAWFALISLVLIAAVVFLRATPDDIESYTGYLNAVFLPLAGVVGAYMGFSTWGGNKFFDSRGKEPEQVNVEVTTTTDQSAG